jgi:hypothetical protein
VIRRLFNVSVAILAVLALYAMFISTHPGSDRHVRRMVDIIPPRTH